MTPLALPAGSAPLVEAVRTALTGEDIPPAALIGGLAVTVRVATPDITYRGTADIDIVTTAADPTLVEILTERHGHDDAIQIGGIKVDVIATHAVTDADLEGIDDGPRLFVVGHRWALDTATPTALTAPGIEEFTVPVATPAALLVMKAHAAGFARSQRRATKHAADLLDLFRLVEVHDQRGHFAQEVSQAPGQVAPVIAGVIEAEHLANPAKAANLMSTAAGRPIAARDVVEILEPFAAELSDA